MRVLFFGDYPNRVGGAQKSLLAALQRIGEHGIEPLLVFPAPGPYEELCRSRGIPVHILEGPEAFNTFGKALLQLTPAELIRLAASELAPYWRRLARFTERVGAEAVHFNTQRGLVMAGPSIHLSGRGSVLHLRGEPALGKPIWILSQMLADRIIVVARSIEAYLAPSARRRARLVYNGIITPDPIPRDVARARISSDLAARGVSITPDTKIFASLSAYVPFKGLHHLIEAASIARERGVQAVYCLAGQQSFASEYESFLRRRVVELGLQESIVFLGHIDRVHELLAGSDGMLLTSVVGKETVTFDSTRIEVKGSEGLPRSILESMSAGTPVIATDGGGVREQLTEDVTGLMVSADTKALADAIVRLASDPNCCIRSRTEGPDVVRDRFSIDAAARGLADVLREVRSAPGLTQRVPAIASLVADAIRLQKATAPSP